MHIIIAADKKRIVDRNEKTAIVDQRANLVNEPRAFIHLIDPDLGCAGEKGRIDQNAIEKGVGPLHVADLFEEIPGNEIPFADGKTIQSVG